MELTVLTRERLSREFSYDPDTGHWTRLCVASNGKGAVGERVGNLHKFGYRQFKIDGIPRKEHRLAFLWMTGAFPPADVDHRNLDKSDNRWANLRAASRSQNMANKPRGAANTSGFKGVSWFKPTRKWCAQIRVNGHGKTLGLFDCPVAAHFAYVIAANNAFGEFSRAA